MLSPSIWNGVPHVKLVAPTAFTPEDAYNSPPEEGGFVDHPEGVLAEAEGAEGAAADSTEEGVEKPAEGEKGKEEPKKEEKAPAEKK